MTRSASRFTLLFSIFALCAAPLRGAFWEPHAAGEYTISKIPYVDPTSTDYVEDESEPWVQQMRNFRDVLRADAFRPKPTPTPAPTPTPTPIVSTGPDGTTWTVVNPILTFTTATTTYYPGYNPNPPHPLHDYFLDVADLYQSNGFAGIAKVLKGAGFVVENLITKKGKNRFRAARELARKLENAVVVSSDAPLFTTYNTGYPWAYYGTLTLSWDDFRGVASNFAQSLSIAARNAFAGHALTRDIAYLPQALTFTIGKRNYGSEGMLSQFYKTDGRGGATVTTLQSPEPIYYGDGLGSAMTLFGSSANSLRVSVVGTPTPSPTP